VWDACGGRTSSAMLRAKSRFFAHHPRFLASAAVSTAIRINPYFFLRPVKQA
jgi:hypothetical protein